jgi:hypothetical protein
LVLPTSSLLRLRLRFAPSSSSEDVSLSNTFFSQRRLRFTLVRLKTFAFEALRSARDDFNPFGRGSGGRKHVRLLIVAKEKRSVDTYTTTDNIPERL